MLNQAAIEMMAREDFHWAMRQGFWRSLGRLLRRKNRRLVSFSAVYKGASLKNRHQLGLQTVKIDDIVGSMSRSNDFDGDFYPRQARTAHRWISIARAFYQHAGLPAVDLVKLDGRYFVQDGHHRISVARARGQELIEANVTEIETG